MLTVRELVAMPHVRTRVLAGEGGLDRPIAWAQVFDHAEPWVWLERDELVMTTGPTLMAGARAQSEYVTRLAEAGAAGLAIGEHHLGPQLTGAMLATADRLAFPVLETAWEVSWATVARTVADAGRDQAVLALSATERIYSALRAATLAGLSGGRLIADVAASQACTAVVLERESGRVLLRDPARPVPDVLIARAREVLHRVAPLGIPSNGRLRAGEHRGVVVPLSRAGGAVLVVGHAEHRDPGPVVLRHLATVASGEHEQVTVNRQREQRRGAELLERLLGGRLSPESVRTEFADHGLDGDLMAVAVGVEPDDGRLAQIYSALEEDDLPALVGDGGEFVIVLTAARPHTHDALIGALPPRTPLGISEPASGPEDVAEAVRQARWSLNLARTTGVAVVRHADQRLAAFLPGTAEDARGVVDRVLGPLLEHDAAKPTELLHSLRTFLEENRSWQKAASKLFVHKQTLVYRMRKVEELTGLQLDSTEDVTQLWLALRTRDMLG